MWGQQRQATAPAPPLLASADFPSLLTSPSHTHLPASMPAPQPSRPAPTSAPAPPSRSEPTFTASELKEFGRELAFGVAECLVRILGAKVDNSALEKAMSDIVDKVVTKTIASRSDMSRKPSPAKPRARSSSLSRVQAKTTPLPTLAGLTPATARIEMERQALGLPALEKRTQLRATPPKVSPSSNGTA